MTEMLGFEGEEVVSIARVVSGRKGQGGRHSYTNPKDTPMAQYSDRQKQRRR